MDSGADECVFPASNADLSLPPTTELVAANGSAIKTFGKRRMAISFAAGHRTFHTFWIATVKRPILGADFFFDNEMVIDIGNRRLLSRSGHVFQAELTSLPEISGVRVPASGPFEALLESFPDLTQQDFKSAVKH